MRQLRTAETGPARTGPARAAGERSPRAALSGPILFNLAFGIYLLATVVMTQLLGEPHGVVEMAMRGTRDAVLVLVLLGLSLFVTFYGLWRGAAQGLATRLLAAILIGCGLYLYLLPAFAVVKGMVSLPFGFWADPWLARLDHALHGGQDAWRLYWPLVEVVPPRLAFIGYNYGWAVISMVLPVLVAALDTDTARRDRMLIVYVFVWIGLGNIAATAFASVGPVYYESLSGIPRYAEYMQHREGLLPPDHAVRVLQDLLWANVELRQGRLGLGISAFPSVHVGIAALVMVYLMSLGRLAGVLGIGFCVLTQWSSVIYGWHYAIDGYASIISVIAVWIGAGWLTKNPARTGQKMQEMPPDTRAYD
ncbi:phosphatase PAP2 family protein [Pontivivens nitratireducens]|uniref:phosphatase PAP2 family protein n=1 Tax=Pontivivens nitratireducens TaxID=2758038 RepID=UPI00163A344B